jgi:hypothetical protein
LPCPKHHELGALGIAPPLLIDADLMAAGMIATSKRQKSFIATISHNLTGQIDEKTVALLSEVDIIAGGLKLAFFIVGATARDILLQHALAFRQQGSRWMSISARLSLIGSVSRFEGSSCAHGNFSPTRQAGGLQGQGAKGAAVSAIASPWQRRIWSPPACP